MGKTSNNIKNKYNRENYVQIKVSVKPETAAAFKAVCESLNVSMASELSGFMASRTNIPALGRSETDFLTSRGGRRKLVCALIEQLEQIKTFEERYRENIPANLEGSERYENAEHSVSSLEEAIEILKEAY